MGIRFWCIVVSHLLGIKSYLFGDRDEPPLVIAPIHPLAADLGAAHEELLRRGGPVRFEPYTRPTNFAIRLIALFILMALSVVIISLSVITIPVWLGRLVISFWPAMLPATSEPSQLPNIHELYSIACGICICWLSVRAVCFVAIWWPEGRTAIINSLKFWCKKWFKISSKAMVAFIVWLGIIPFLFGLLFKLVMVVPYQIPLNHTPVFWVWQDWALGLIFMQFACIIILMGPDRSLKRAIKRTYQDGFMRLNLKLMMRDLAIPVITVLSLFLAVPYVIAYSVVPLFIKNQAMRLQIARQIYPKGLFMLAIIKIMMMLVSQFKKLYERIKNDKYLVGRRLVNYNHTDSVSDQN